MELHTAEKCINYCDCIKIHNFQKPYNKAKNQVTEY